MADAWGTTWVRDGTAAWDATWEAGPEREFGLSQGGEIDMYWTPSSAALLLTSSAGAITQGDMQIEGVALFANLGTTAAFVGVVSAEATTDEINFMPLPGGGILYVAFGDPMIYALVTGASSVYAQAGYALK